MLDGRRDLVRADGEAGADDGTGIGLIETGPPAQQTQALGAGDGDAFRRSTAQVRDTATGCGAANRAPSNVSPEKVASRKLA